MRDVRVINTVSLGRGARWHPLMAALLSMILDRSDRNTKPMTCHCHMAVGIHMAASDGVQIENVGTLHGLHAP